MVAPAGRTLRRPWRHQALIGPAGTSEYDRFDRLTSAEGSSLAMRGRSDVRPAVRGEEGRGLDVLAPPSLAVDRFELCDGRG